MSVLYAHAFVHVATCVYHLYVRTTIFIYIFILFCDRVNVQLSIESQFSHWGMETVFFESRLHEKNMILCSRYVYKFDVAPCTRMYS